MTGDVVLSCKARYEVQPWIGQVEIDTLSYRWAQQGIATLVEHTTVVYDHGSQHAIWRTGDALAIAQLSTPLILLPCCREVREPVVIGTTGLFLSDAERMVVGWYMLEAQTCIQVPLSQLELVLGKTGDVLFVHLGIGFGYDVFLIAVMAVAQCGCSLRATAQLAFPDGIGQHQLTGGHGSFLFCLGGEDAVAEFFTQFLLIVIILWFASQYRGIQINTQLTRFAYIVGVQFPYRFVFFADICFQTNIAVKGTVFQIVLRHICLKTTIQVLLRWETQSYGVIGAEVVAESSLVLQLRPTTPDGYHCLTTEQVFFDM